MSGIVTGVCVGFSMGWGCLCNWYGYIGDVVFVRDRHTPFAHGAPVHTGPLCTTSEGHPDTPMT